MTPQRWRKVSEVFTTCVEHGPEHHASLLSRLCGSDLSLRSDVESLLASDAKATGFLQADARCDAVPAPTNVSLSDVGAGRHVGAYRLIRPLAAGGMGTVWLAERADNQFHGRAAIKLINRGMDTDDLLLRFRQERQLLANLHHPNICRLIDGGAADDGRPYIIMEYVEGEPITAYGNRHRLTVEARLELFLRVADAVQAAHQSLVVHRDLKPGNILVRENGEPTLLDFGIAKVLDQDSSEPTHATVANRRLFTPEYASPEQFKCQSVGTASDVYSLGVILYEMLCGVRPFHDTGGSTELLQSRILGEDPPRPSATLDRTRVPSADSASMKSSHDPAQCAAARGLTPAQLKRGLSGDLDTIILKALQKEPGRRYPSVAQFADDIRRHLDGRPVLARPDGFAYRSRKFIRRNRAIVASLSVIFVAVTALAVTMTVQSYRIANERNKAVEAEKLAEETERFVSEMLRSIEPSVARGRDITILREMLDRASNNVDLEFGAHPVVRARLHFMIGDIYERLRLFDVAEPHLREALALRQKVFPPNSPEIAQAMHGLAALLLQSTNHNAEAETLCRQALDICRSLDGNHQLLVAQCYNNLGTALHHQGRLVEALELGRTAVELVRKTDNSLALAGIVNDVGGTLMSANMHADAASMFREAIAIWAQNREFYLGWLGVGHVNLGICLTKLRELADAEQACLVGIKLLQEATGESGHFWARNQLGTVYLYQGNYAAAESIYADALVARAASTADRDMNWANLQHNLAMMRVARGDFISAEKPLRDVLAYLVNVLGDRDQTVAVVKRNLAILLIALERSAEAEGILIDAMDAQTAAFPHGNLAEAETLNVLGLLHLQCYATPVIAEALFSRALALYRDSDYVTNTEITGPLNGLAKALIEQGRYDEAEQFVSEALAMQCRLVDIDNPDWAATLTHLGDIQLHRGLFAQAEASYRRAVEIRALRLVPRHPDTLDSMNRLVNLYARWNQPIQEAEARRTLATARSSESTGQIISEVP